MPQAGAEAEQKKGKGLAIQLRGTQLRESLGSRSFVSNTASHHQKSSSKFESDYGNRPKVTITNFTEGEETGNFKVTEPNVQV